MNQMRLGIGTAALVLTAVTAMAQPLGTNFTYQGQLKESGTPAGGTYDLRFRLFDAAVGGAQIGATDCVDGVMPVDGLFTVEIDFGAVAFDGSSRWLEIGVRSDATPANCAAGPAYTVLTTRQPLTAVPYAMYALDGPGAPGFWAANGTAISNTNTGFVGIKRSTQVSGAEYFGVQAPVASGYGGMYIRTDGATGLPFYGYKAGSSGETAWTYLDGVTGDWRVNVDGDRLTVTDTGLVGIGTTNPSGPLEVYHPLGSLGSVVISAPIGVPGIVGYANNGNRRDIRFLDGGIGLYTNDGPGIPVTGNGITINDAGNVGIGTAGPGSKLEVVPTLGQWGVRVLNDGQNSAIYATSSGGTAPTVYGVSSSTLASSVAVHGLMSGVSPGAGSAGVRGTISSSTSDDTYGVYGKHNGNGWGVYGEGLGGSSVGVQGLGWWGVYGTANSTTGYGVVAAGSGFLGSGQALFVLGESHLNTTGIGTTNPAAILHVTSNSDAEPGGGGIIVVGNVAAGNIAIDGNEIMARNNGATSTLYLNNDGGTVRVPVLEITGADVAERFPISEARESVKPGTVMEIDPDNAGKLRIARGAYNARVAGVVSGAGDVPVGAILGNLPGSEDAPPIALSGRVWVQCDASEAAIGVGDMLTTSETAGHAMKAVDRPRAQGAIIGKAMSQLAAGEKGLVLVLVNLQ